MTKFYRVKINFVDENVKDFWNNHVFLNKEQYKIYKSVKKEIHMIWIKKLEEKNLYL